MSLGDLLVSPPLGGARHELLVPLVHARDVGEAALRERAQQVERARRLVVGAQHALGIGYARLGGGRVVVDDVPVEGGQVDRPDPFGGQRARLCELARDAADLHDRQRRRVGQDDRHLQQDPELLADRHRGGVVERLRAVTGLQQEGATGRDVGERVAKRPRLAREDERRHPAQLLARDLGARGIGPDRLLQRLVRVPGGRRPGSFGDCHASPSLRSSRRDQREWPGGCSPGALTRRVRGHAHAARLAPGRAPRRARRRRAAGRRRPPGATRRGARRRSPGRAGGGPAARH